MMGRIETPSHWKCATPRSLVFTVILVAVVAISFGYLLLWTCKTLSRPVTEEDKDAMWRTLSEAAQRHSTNGN